ncbi:hypothetical protein [Burkholderia sp. IMCC1007]|uniref:hypothetical protein n=1 Tax=Burkholderia sp. IMCC1007 TaxID=3004104 RepID=UPI0022B3CBE3|nr:hypothetical protein [Burkholderia sp. IMCC1007]
MYLRIDRWARAWAPESVVRAPIAVGRMTVHQAAFDHFFVVHAPVTSFVQFVVVSAHSDAEIRRCAPRLGTIMLAVRIKTLRATSANSIRTSIIHLAEA